MRTPPRQRCPYCGDYYQLKYDGTLRPHKAWWRDEFVWCPQIKSATADDVRRAQDSNGVINPYVAA